MKKIFDQEQVEQIEDDVAELLHDHLYNDPRPLTDEILKEMGFKTNVLVTKGGITLMAWHQEVRDGDKIWVEIANSTDKKRPKFKTVGSVRRLIEALKGDE